MKHQINIDLSQIKEISLKGIGRAAVFMGLGINAARTDEFKDYHLSNETFLRIIPENVDNAQVKDFKKHFEQWIISCGLRELIETFSVYLCAIFKACLLASINKKKMLIEDPDKQLKSFEWKGVEKQLKTLRDRFNVKTSKEIYFKTINQVRNCITHRRGIVGVEDLGDKNCLRICWWALEPFIATPSGEIPINPQIPEGGIYLKDGGTICLRVVEKEREFQLGEVIKLNPNDLYEICLLVTLATEDILKSTFDFLKSTGIEIKQTEIKKNK